MHGLYVPKRTYEGVWWCWEQRKGRCNIVSVVCTAWVCDWSSAKRCHISALSWPAWNVLCNTTYMVHINMTNTHTHTHTHTCSSDLCAAWEEISTPIYALRLWTRAERRMQPICAFGKEKKKGKNSEAGKKDEVCAIVCLCPLKANQIILSAVMLK